MQLKGILCMLGLHRWSRKKFYTSTGSSVKDYSQYCLRCKKLKKWVEAKY